MEVYGCNRTSFIEVVTFGCIVARIVSIPQECELENKSVKYSTESCPKSITSHQIPKE